VEENGRKKVAKLGMKTEQRDGFEYEFTVVLDIIHDGHYAVASKDRTGLFAGDAKPISETTGRTLLAWLETGVEPPKFADYLGAIDKAATVEALKTAYNAAYRFAGTDDEMIIQFTAAKDQRKEQLTTQEAA
jgi:hypothetical protein